MVVPTKLYVGNLPESCRKQDLAATFEKYGKLVECDIVKNYAFVHFENQDDAKQAVAELDNSEFQGVTMKVELSHSRVRQKPGMGGTNECFMCGKKGHWSKECPKRPKRERMNDDDDFGPPPPPFDDPYLRDPRADPYLRDPRDLYRRDPYAELYAARERYRPYPSPYERRRLPPLPSPDPYSYRERDPYARPPPDYYTRRSSPPRDPYLDLYYSRRYPLPPAPLGRLSPGPPRQRALPPY